MSDLTLSVPEMQDLLIEAYVCDPKQNLGFRGSPGIGKTEGIYGAANILRETHPDFFTKVVILSQCESVDFRMPFVYGSDEKRYTFLPHDDYIFSKDAKGFLFFDEAPNASMDVLKAIQQIASDRRLGEIDIPEGIMIVLAGNRKEDRAGVNSIPTSFANRIEWHNIHVDYEAWLDWAHKMKLDVTLTSYIKRNPSKLNIFQADKDVNPTPRTWHKMDKVMKSQFFMHRAAGLIGEENAVEFVAWTKMWQQFPTREEVIANPKTALKPVSPDAEFALTCGLVNWVNKRDWSQIYKYMTRFEVEYQTLFMKESTRLHPKELLKETREYSDWITRHQGKLI
jgi:hypothetical protein